MVAFLIYLLIITFCTGLTYGQQMSPDVAAWQVLDAAFRTCRLYYVPPSGPTGHLAPPHYSTPHCTSTAAQWAASPLNPMNNQAPMARGH